MSRSLVFAKGRQVVCGSGAGVFSLAPEHSPGPPQDPLSCSPLRWEAEVGMFCGCLGAQE